MDVLFGFAKDSIEDAVSSKDGAALFDATASTLGGELE